MRRTLGEGDASILILILPQSSRRGPGHRKVIASAETETETEAVIMGQGPGHGSIHPAGLAPTLLLSAGVVSWSNLCQCISDSLAVASHVRIPEPQSQSCPLPPSRCSFFRPTPKCPCWQQHNNNKRNNNNGGTNNAASTYQVIKQPKASAVLIPLVMSTCHETHFEHRKIKN